MPPVIDIEKLRERYYDDGSQPAGAAPAAPAPEPPTFAQRILRDIPARVAAARAKLMAGDTAGGKADLDYVGSWIDDNQDSLEEFTNYTGTNRTAQLIAQKSLGLLSREDITGLLPATDPDFNERSVDFEAARNGWGPAMTDVVRKARFDKDPYSVAMLAEYGRAPAPRRPARPGQGQGAQPQEDQDPAARLESQIKYTKTFAARVSPVVPLEADEMVGLARIGFDAGDMESGTRLTDIAVRAARESGLDDLGRGNVFKASLRATAGAMSAWNAADEVQRAQGAEVLSSLVDASGGVKDFSSRGRQVSQIMGETSAAISQYRELGIDVSGAAPSLARALYRQKFSGAAPTADEDVPVSSALTRMTQLANAVKNRGVLAGANEAIPAGQAGARQPAAPQPSDGFDLLADVVKRHVMASGGAAIAGGTDVDAELETRNEELARGLVEIGVPDIVQARAAASVVTQILRSGADLDVRTIPQLIAAAPANKKIVEKGIGEAGKAAAAGKAPTPEDKALDTSVQGLENRVYNTVLQREYSRIPKVDQATGRAVTPEDAAKRAKAAADASPDVALYSGLMKMNAANRDLIGVGDRNVTEKAFTDAVAPAVPQIVFEQSPMFDLLYRKTKLGDLDKPAVREAAVKAVEDAYADKANLAWRASQGEVATGEISPLRQFATGQVNRIISNIKAEAERVGSDPAATPEMIIGTKSERLAAIGRAPQAGAWRGPVVAPGGGEIPPPATLDSESMAKPLANIFADNLGVPAGERGVAARARTKVASLVAMPAAPAAEPAKTPAPPTPSVELSLAKITPAQATVGYNALAALTDKLGEGVRDELVDKFVSRDLKEAIDEQKIPWFKSYAIRAGARKLAVNGYALEDIQRFAAEELAKVSAANLEQAFNAKVAWKKAEVEISRAAGGSLALGGAEVDETDAGNR